MTDEAVAEVVIAQSLKAKHLTQPQIARMARRKKLLDKVRDADIQALLAVVRAYQADGSECDALTDELIEKMMEEKTYEQIEMLCLEVLELRKRLRRLGMDSNWEPVDE